MNLVDSSGWLEYFADGKNAKYFAPAVEESSKLIVSTVNLYEVYKKVMSERNENSAKEAVGMMMQGIIIEVDSSIAIRAARLSCELKIPMSDSLIYVTAQLNNAIVWTQDYDFKDLDGVKFIKKN
ncbi:MAG TPA: type II toxin-antitoxin system VapC family toxin [Ignavibacteria bacterium]|nr:type II toxin-antitoxin system VapC family toxin [Ignavibacteria bacterium]